MRTGHAQAFARTLVLRKRDLEIVFSNEARLDQALTDFLTHPRLLTAFEKQLPNGLR
jgi:hypothetical protein